VGILAADFAGIVPASRGAHCRPLHPRLASSLLFREEKSMLAEESSHKSEPKNSTGTPSQDRIRTIIAAHLFAWPIPIFKVMAESGHESPFFNSRRN
jgi:hypothetical protein